jgi:hypothetical protein
VAIGLLVAQFAPINYWSVAPLLPASTYLVGLDVLMEVPRVALRLLHLGGLLAWAALVLALALLAFDLEGARPAQPPLALLRNLAGLTGLALLSARLISARAAWIAPLAFLTFSTVAVRQVEAPTLWAWPFRAGADGAPRVAALALLVVSLWLVCSHRARAIRRRIARNPEALTQHGRKATVAQS